MLPYETSYWCFHVKLPLTGSRQWCITFWCQDFCDGAVLPGSAIPVDSAFDMVKLSASKISFLKLMKILVSFNLYFPSNGSFWGILFFIMFVSSVICRQSNHPEQCQHRCAWQAEQGRAGGVEECQERSYEALGEMAKESRLWSSLHHWCLADSPGADRVTCDQCNALSVGTSH